LSGLWWSGLLALSLAVWAPLAVHAQAVDAAVESENTGAEPAPPSTLSLSLRDRARGLERSSIGLQGEGGAGLKPPGKVEEDGPDEDADVSPSESGIASWYGPGFHKRRTASGERFDMNALTAAHRTLPFGTLVCVRSQATGREVVVRINDRGPHVANRVMDLSRGAAMVLGLHGLGLKPVDVFPLGADDTACPPRRND
jgi:rare lipoprotein A